MSDTVNRSGNAIRFDRKIPVEHDLIQVVGIFGKTRPIKWVNYEWDGLFSAHIRAFREHRVKVYSRQLEKLDRMKL